MSTRIGVLLLSTTPMSIRIYVERLRYRLSQNDLELVLFDDPSKTPDADVYWDPRTGGGRAPTASLLKLGRPVIATLHDMAHVSLPWRDFYPDLKQAIRGRVHCFRVAREWQRAKPHLTRVIVPSEISRDEAVHILGLSPELISIIPHGVEHKDFASPRCSDAVQSPYFLHISQFQPRKNLPRLLAAYRALPAKGRPRLVIKMIGYTGPRNIEGVEFIDGVMTQQEIANLYANALVFVFPSLNEGFGMPILEAMASGCPVITSKGTACAEVAGDAAYLVDPRSVVELSAAMQRLAVESSERARLKDKGLARAREFDWDISARRHADVFKQALTC